MARTKKAAVETTPAEVKAETVTETAETTAPETTPAEVKAGDEVKGDEQPTTPAPAAKAVRTAKVADDTVIRLLASANPKKAGSKSFTRFALYVDGMTVKAALAAGVIRPDLAWDSARNFIALEAPQPAVEPTAPAVS